MSNTIVAEKYGWKSEIAEHSHAYLIPPVLNILRKEKIASLLDVGTGNGSALPYWLNESIKVSAIEPDPEGFQFSRQNEAADVRQFGVGDKLPTEWNAAFDACISLEVIEHLFDPQQLVNTCRYCLRQNGIAIISTPYHGYLKNLALALKGNWDFHHDPQRVGGHIKFWSRKTLNMLFTENNFELISFKGAGRAPYLWKSMIMVFRKN